MLVWMVSLCDMVAICSMLLMVDIYTCIFMFDAGMGILFGLVVVYVSYIGEGG